jgi:hypothetical protein
MKLIFVELPAFRRYREDYLGDDEYRKLQQELLAHPTAGDVIKGTGGLRKLRFGSSKRAKENVAEYASSITTGFRVRKSGCSPCTARTKWMTCLTKNGRNWRTS